MKKYVDTLHQDIEKQALLLSNLLLEKKINMSCAESCTGGGLGFFLTSLPGSSKWFDGGFITYSNDNKIQQLNIPPEIITRYGAVSEETACVMATAALKKTKTHLCVSITGIAGPEGGTQDKPVGLVWFGCAAANDLKAEKKIFSGTRQEIRLQSILHAIKVCLQFMLSSKK